MSSSSTPIANPTWVDKNTNTTLFMFSALFILIWPGIQGTRSSNRATLFPARDRSTPERLYQYPHDSSVTNSDTKSNQSNLLYTTLRVHVRQVHTIISLSTPCTALFRLYF
ncbi:957c4129-541e-42b7-b66b-bba250bc3ac9 [Sclerotinia trifoliorum]|uniref:957c4129-541e-42b7-b66b-bba250bc3ac9 n=1 Tax=Sclerotinia trifoliorum TaxID=28548 RepID=A0A8H2W2R3_9HELO|nr:957c4129-541e-42b7-b66b-bba250bc3ac9 [Sclerotinia trifoliorum]